MLSLSLLNIPSVEVELSGAWTAKGRQHTWAGKLAALEPIVAINLLRRENRVKWVRSSKRIQNTLDVRISVAGDANTNYYWVSWGIDEGFVQSYQEFVNPEFVPTLPAQLNVTTGKCFQLVPAFGDPVVELWALVLLRDQVKCARKGLWHLRNKFRDGVPEPWLRMLTYGRTGTFTL